jgi:hypothetical protein
MADEEVLKLPLEVPWNLASTTQLLTRISHRNKKR